MSETIDRIVCVRCGRDGHRASQCKQPIGRTKLSMAVVARLVSGPCTADEIAYELLIDPQTVHKHLKAAQAMHLVRPVGVRVTGKAGKSPMVWGWAA